MFCFLASIPGLLPASLPESASPSVAETRAVAFLSQEVPLWFKENACYSCHNNGDGFRALVTARRHGFRVPDSVLANTTAWLRNPSRWSENKGDPAFSDKRLADVQFASSVLAATEQGLLKSGSALDAAAARVIRGQASDGSWPIDSGASVGSPVTYGAVLTTLTAARILRKSSTPQSRRAAASALRFLSTVKPRNLIETAALVWLNPGRADLVTRLESGQNPYGGWGPFKDSPSEVFDTALVLLALKSLRKHPGMAERIERGRAFLKKEQNPDGSWPETTRPSGGESYAQRVSTSAWGLMALLETRPEKTQRIRNGRRTTSEVRLR